MISSEVQRTLVKSPPELWSELSDEAALARHLSRFARVRITNLNAEERIDWSADGARGSILINPSGWGTRVTLTLQRDGAAPAAPAPQPQPVTPEAAPQPVVPDAGARPDTAAAPRAAPADASAAQPPAAAPASATPERSAPERSAPADVQTPRDSTQEHLTQSDATATAAGGIQEDGELDAQATFEPAPSATHGAVEEPADATPRRRFFARLASGWQRALEWAERPSDAAQPAPDAAQAQHRATPAGDASREVADGSAVAAPGSSSQAGPADGGSAIESPRPSPTPAPATLAAPRGSADEQGGHLTGHLSSPSPSQSAHASPSQDSASSEPEPAASATRSPRPHPADSEEKDISAELRAVEEAASEGDAAVLTAVLDSLGSAHHRPFSRS